MVKGLGRKMNVYTAPQKAKETAKAVKNVATNLTKPNKLTKPLQGGIGDVGKESNYASYLDLMA